MTRRKQLFTAPVIVLVGHLAAAEAVIHSIPGAASAPGDQGAFIVSDLRLFNPDRNDTIAVVEFEAGALRN